MEQDKEVEELEFKKYLKAIPLYKYQLPFDPEMKYLEEARRDAFTAGRKSPSAGVALDENKLLEIAKEAWDSESVII